MSNRLPFFFILEKLQGNFTRILLEKVTFFLFIRKIGRFKYKSGDREICHEIGSLPIKSGGLEPLGLVQKSNDVYVHTKPPSAPFSSRSV